MRFTFKLIQRISLAALLATTLASAIQGQQNPARTSLDRVLIKRTREFNNREMENELHRRPLDEKEQQMALAQIKEDYVRLQIVNRDLAQAASLKGALDLKFVTKSAAEIKKRAARLKYNLVLPKSEDAELKTPDANVGTEAEQLQSSVTALSTSINAFVNNPLFKQVNVVDVHSSVKARRDLERIIVLSEHVKKSSEKLEKTAPKFQ